MLWVITHDHTSVGAIGISSTAGDVEMREMLRSLEDGDPSILPEGVKRFRMLDEGSVVVEGWALVEDEDSGFEPLEEFGWATMECTAIEYRDRQGEWEKLDG